MGEAINDITAGVCKVVAFVKRRSISESPTIHQRAYLGIFWEVLCENGEESNERHEKLILMLKSRGMY
jgi:hypothetical protein